MRQNESKSVFKVFIFIFCIINVLALIFMIKWTSSSVDAETITYTLPPAEVEETNEVSNNASLFPKLYISRDSFPEFEQDDLYDLLAVLKEKELIYAEDSEGVDITDAVEYSISADRDTPGEFDVTFSVTDEARRTVAETVSLQVELTSPFLMFYENPTSITSGDKFSITNCVSVAMDVDGANLIDYIEMDGYVDTYTPGTYNIEIYVYSRVDNSLTRRPLEVIVE